MVIKSKMSIPCLKLIIEKASNLMIISRLKKTLNICIKIKNVMSQNEVIKYYNTKNYM